MLDLNKMSEKITEIIPLEKATDEPKMLKLKEIAKNSSELKTSEKKEYSVQISEDDSIMLTLEALNSADGILDKKKQPTSNTASDVKASNEEKTVLNTALKTSTNAVNVSKPKPAPRVLNKEVAAKNNAAKRLNAKHNSAKSIDSNEDLVAILEGKNVADSETEEYQLLDLIPNEDDDHNNENELNEDKSTVLTTLMTKEEERKIALAQMSKFTKKTKPLRKAKSPPATTELVTSLVSDWSDGEKDPEAGSGENKKDKNKSKTGPIKILVKKDQTEIKTSAIVEPLPVTDSSGIAPFKRSRIIKKKIIWDPDAPETQFSYASLLKKSPIKKENKVVTVKKLSNVPVQAKVQISNSSSASPKIAPLKVETELSPLSTKGKKLTATVLPLDPPKIINGKKRKIIAPTTTATIVTTTINSDSKLSPPPAKVTSSIEIKSQSPKIAKIEKNLSTSSLELQTVPVAEKPLKKDSTVAQKKRGANKIKQPTASSSWDYVYKQQTEDAMIIRRRSNSSYSSTTSPSRLSMEQTIPSSSIKTTNTNSTKPTAANKRKQDFQFAKPQNRKSSENENNLAENAIVFDIKKLPARKSARTPTNIIDSNETTAVANSEIGDKNIIEVTVKKIGKVGQIIINSTKNESTIKDSFNALLMNKIVFHLDALKKENNCKIVVITSKNTSFCQGIDFSTLIANTVEKRKIAAQDLSKSLKNFIETLISFPKPLIAAVTGSIINLGVTMLPLFDIVIASEKCLFETSYVKIGQIPEGYCTLLSANNLIGNNIIKKMLYLGEKLTATEANQCGLITKLTQNDKVDEEAIAMAKKMSLLSQQSLTSMKALRNTINFNELTKLLDEEHKNLINQWSSAECQEKFKEFIKTEHW